MDWGLSLLEKPTRRTTLAFLVLSWTGILFVFGGALWGTTILAPLDITPTLYTKYRWVDPTLGNIPRNHYLVDIVDYELPRTYLAHRSLALGEFPWWDPYSFGGGPLAAESHIGVSDPIRLIIFSLCRFVTAYNWIRILQSFLCGLGMFLLLRFLGFAQFTTVLGALSFQFSASQASFYYTLPLHSSLYYPFLWLVLAKYTRTRPALAAGLGGLLCAAILMSGTQQSHTYLVLFLLCFVVANGLCFRRAITSIIVSASGAFALGCLISAPILVPQVELFRLSTRKLALEGGGTYLLTGLFSLTGIFPWFTGSFRTLDLSKLVEQPAVAYLIYIGTPAMILALVGIFGGTKPAPTGHAEAKTALLLTLLYLLAICSTPLLKLLYIRSAALGVLGLTVLFATGWEMLIHRAWPRADSIVRWIVSLLAVGVIATHVFVWAAYPRLKERVLSFVLKKEADNPSMPTAPELRAFQVNNLANEVTFKNPEPLLAFLGALCVLGFISTPSRYRGIFATGVFTLNLLPLLIFSHRGMPRSPVEYWYRLLAGGSEQRAIIDVTGHDLRLKEEVFDRLDYAFPGTTAALYQIHPLHGYVSLGLIGPGQMGVRRDYNVLYVSERRKEHGEIRLVRTNQVRFVWSERGERPVRIIHETPNSIQLRIDAGVAGELVRTDTYYPGWRVEKPKAIAQHRNSEGFLALSIPAEATDLVLRYQPSWSQVTRPVCVASLAMVTALLVAATRFRTLAARRSNRTGAAVINGNGRTLHDKG
jgi:hypothetical protein